MKIPFSVAVVAEALDLTIGSNGQMTGLCPCHNDTRNSLSAKIDAETGNLLTYCHAGCDQVEVYRTVVDKYEKYVADHDIQIDPSHLEVTTSAPVTKKQDKIKFAQDIWHNADFDADTVNKYLIGRGLSGENLPDAIRQASLEHTPGSGETYPCMIAEITDVNSNFTGTHITYLAEVKHGKITKASVQSPKKILGSMKGNHIALSDEYQETIHLTEGIEKGLAVRETLSASVWACLSATNLAAVELPDDISIVYVWGDNDLSGAGQKFAEIAAKRFTEAGKTVYVLIPDAEIPEGAKSIDWSDMGAEAIKVAYENAKPFVVQREEPWGHIIVPPHFSISRNAVMREKPQSNGRMQTVLVATGPIWISKERIDLESGESELEISWMDEKGRIYSRAVSRGLAFKRSTILDMAGLAFFPTYDGKQGETVRFLALLAHHNTFPTELIVRKPGWNKTPAGLQVFIANKNNTEILFHPEPAYQTYADALNNRGSMDEWLKVVKPIATKYPIALFAILASLASPLLRILAAPNFVIDFWGRTSCGKTSLLQVLASIWGNPSGLILSWNNTITFSERLASFYGNGFNLFLDDSQTASDKLLEVITYMLANGCGKGRAKPYSLKETEKFQVVMFATGEKPLTERAYPGAKARVIEINGSPFPEIDPAELQTLKSTIMRNHGHLGNRFIETLKGVSDEHVVMMHEQCLNHYTDLANNEIGNRHAAYFGTVRVAGEILSHTPGMEWIKPHVDKAIEHVWALSTVEMEETDMATKALAGIAAWIESNKRHFATPGTQTELQPTYGVLKGKEGFVAIIPHIFKQALRDIDIPSAAAVLAEWKAKGFLLFTPGRSQKQVKVEGKNIWCICIELKSLYPEQNDPSPSNLPVVPANSTTRQI